MVVSHLLVWLICSDILPNRPADSAKFPSAQADNGMSKIMSTQLIYPTNPPAPPSTVCHIPVIQRDGDTDKSCVIPTNMHCFDHLAGMVDHWCKDEGSESCVGCGVRFTIYERRHHCRACGRLFCSSCSQYQSEIPELKILQKVRVCKPCLGKLEEAKKRTK